MAPDDNDDPVRGTGPSYRGVSPSHRGIDDIARGLARPTRIAQAQSAVTPQKLAAQQQQAEAIRDQLLPFFVSELSTTVGGKLKPYNSRIGTKIATVVLDRPAFSKKLSEQQISQAAEDAAAFVRYRTTDANKAIDIARGSLQGHYPSPVTPTTPIDPKDALAVFPQVERVQPARVAAFYFNKDDTLYVQMGDAKDNVIAHELCHAYAHAAWNDMQIEFSVFPLKSGPMSEIDEGITSEMANIVLLAFAHSQSGGAPVTPSNGYVGYPSTVQVRATKFMSAVDGSSSPGPRTMEAYFGGKIRISLDVKHVDDSTIGFGTKEKVIKLKDVVS